MNKTLLLLFCFLCVSSIGLSQEKEKVAQEKDSITNEIEKEGVVVDSAFLAKKKVINPLAPSKAAFYSAVLPGLGQIYNKRYWKVPIVYAAIGTGIYAYTYNHDRYVRFRNAYKSRLAGFTTDEFYDYRSPGGEIPDTPDISTEALEDGQERYQRDRDLSLVITIALYALNIIDANVDAHLKQFNVDDDLSLNIKPSLEYNPITASPNYGVALTITF